MIKATTKKKTREEILEISVPLFANGGYDGVSMRDVAAAIGLTTAALYYHFTDKEQLYLDVMAHEFREKPSELTTILKGSEPPWVRLEKFIVEFTNLVAADKNFLRLIQWLRLESDEARHQKLAEYVFKDIFVSIHDLVAELDSRYDAHMLAMSIIALMSFPFESTTRKFMPGYQPEQDKPSVVAKYVIDLLRTGLSKPAGHVT